MLIQPFVTAMEDESLVFTITLERFPEHHEKLTRKVSSKVSGVSSARRSSDNADEISGDMLSNISGTSNLEFLTLDSNSRSSVVSRVNSQNAVNKRASLLLATGNSRRASVLLSSSGRQSRNSIVGLTPSSGTIGIARRVSLDLAPRATAHSPPPQHTSDWRIREDNELAGSLPSSDFVQLPKINFDAGIKIDQLRGLPASRDSHIQRDKISISQSEASYASADYSSSYKDDSHQASKTAIGEEPTYDSLWSVDDYKSPAHSIADLAKLSRDEATGDFAPSNTTVETSPLAFDDMVNFLDNMISQPHYSSSSQPTPHSDTTSSKSNRLPSSVLSGLFDEMQLKLEKELQHLDKATHSQSTESKKPPHTDRSGTKADLVTRSEIKELKEDLKKTSKSLLTLETDLDGLLFQTLPHLGYTFDSA
jgi:hypothetical protein